MMNGKSKSFGACAVNRRGFVCAAAGFAFAGAGGCFSRRAAATELPRWRPGELDIHFIHTGVGEQTFFIFPDGTTMLLDCGDTHHAKYMCDVPPMPGPERYGGEWTARYVSRVIPDGRREIDYAMVSHWHGDHTGDLAFGGVKTADGRTVCGLPLVAETFRFRRYVDHQYPRIGEHARDPDPGSLSLMREWVPYAMRTHGMTAEKLEVGASGQIRLLHDAAAFPGFEVRNIAGNGVLWDGKKGTIDAAAAHVRATGLDKIHENRLSGAIRIRYGAFSYYTGGDNELTMTGADGREFNWEEAVGRVCGPVSVAKTNHHAGIYGMSPEFVREVRAKVYLSSVWQPGMVHHKSLSAMCSRELYPGERRVCFGYVAEKAKEVAAAYGADIAPAGHAVVKVAPGGGVFEVFTLDASDEEMRVLSRVKFS